MTLFRRRFPVVRVSGAVLSLVVLGGWTAAPALHEAFDAKQAFAYTAQVVSFGERWPGSPGHTKTQALIKDVLTKDGAQIETDDFTATTPRGAVAVHNIIGKFNVTADPKQQIFILAGHYDTLFKPGFLGANDGGSSTAILLSFADALAHQKTKMQIWLDVDRSRGSDQVLPGRRRSLWQPALRAEAEGRGHWCRGSRASSCST